MTQSQDDDRCCVRPFIREILAYFRHSPGKLRKSLCYRDDDVNSAPSEVAQLKVAGDRAVPYSFPSHSRASVGDETSRNSQSKCRQSETRSTKTLEEPSNYRNHNDDGYDGHLFYLQK